MKMIHSLHHLFPAYLVQLFIYLFSVQKYLRGGIATVIGAAVDSPIISDVFLGSLFDTRHGLQCQTLDLTQDWSLICGAIPL